MCCHLFQNYKSVQTDPATVKHLHVYSAQCSRHCVINYVKTLTLAANNNISKYPTCNLH